MSFQGDRNKQGKAKSGPDAAAASLSPARKKRGSPNDVGAALRSAYQHTIDEDIPPEMLDLLGRLT